MKYCSDIIECCCCPRKRNSSPDDEADDQEDDKRQQKQSKLDSSNLLIIKQEVDRATEEAAIAMDEQPGQDESVTNTDVTSEEAGQSVNTKEQFDMNDGDVPSKVQSVITVEPVAGNEESLMKDDSVHGENSSMQDPTDWFDFRKHTSRPFIPPHMQPIKQLRTLSGRSLAVNQEGLIFGTLDKYHSEAVVELTSEEAGEVRIRGLAAGLYVAMNYLGYVYAEKNESNTNTIWLEREEQGWTIFRSKNKNHWLLGIKKNGKMKRGYRTKSDQKAVRFVSTAAYPE